MSHILSEEELRINAELAEEAERASDMMHELPCGDFAGTCPNRLECDPQNCEWVH